MATLANASALADGGVATSADASDDVAATAAATAANGSEDASDDDEDEDAELIAPEVPARASTRAAAPGSLFWDVLVALSLVGVWYGLSTCLSLFNKWFVGTSQYGFEYPLLLTSCHFFLQFAFSALALRLVCAHYRPARPVTWAEYGARIVPSGVASALDIGLSNYSLVFLTLSFYTMCKATSPIFLLAFAFVLGLERLSWQLAGVVAITTCGLVLTVYGESQFNLNGFLLVMSASVMAGLRWTLTQVLLQKKQLGIDNPFATLYFITPVMGTCLSVIGFAVERWWELVRRCPCARAAVVHATLTATPRGKAYAEGSGPRAPPRGARDASRPAQALPPSRPPRRR